MLTKIKAENISGVIENIIASKSLAHRAVICAALSKENTSIHCNSSSKDILVTINCLNALGADIQKNGSLISVKGIKADSKNHNCNKKVVLDCFESGSTLRFLLPLASALNIDCSFIGSERLAKRPLSPLYEQLIQHGRKLSPQGAFPLDCSSGLQSGTYKIAGNVSSQYISGLLFALPLLAENSKIEIIGKLQSKPYVDLTLSILKQFGIHVDFQNNIFDVSGQQTYVSPREITIESDWSGAAFWLSLGALSAKGIVCKGLSIDSLQGDKSIINLLNNFGANIKISNTENKKADITVKKDKLDAINMDASDIPDLVPIIAVLAGLAQGESRIDGIARLRLKESDRVATSIAMLKAFGVDCSADDNSMYIKGSGCINKGEKLKPKFNTVQIDGSNDHRIVMSAAVMAVCSSRNVIISDSQAVNKSYNGFFDIYAKLGAEISFID